MARRAYLNQREWHALVTAQRFMCASCESAGPFEADHSTPNALKAGKPDQLLCRRCHRAKTKRDVAAIAKAKRLSGETLSQYEKRKRFGASLQSRGFRKRGE